MILIMKLIRIEVRSIDLISSLFVYNSNINLEERKYFVCLFLPGRISVDYAVWCFVCLIFLE